MKLLTTTMRQIMASSQMQAQAGPAFLLYAAVDRSSWNQQKKLCMAAGQDVIFL
jgi:hypothetical protein